jgi:hypothetical protein
MHGVVDSQTRQQSPDRVYGDGSVQAIEHGHVPTGMYIVTALLLGGAFFPPAPRVAAFATGIVTIVVLYGKEVPEPLSRVAPVVWHPECSQLPGHGRQNACQQSVLNVDSGPVAVLVLWLN